MGKRDSLPQTLDQTYTTILSTPSSTISNPTTHRKLLVLDLNGTLVFRPKRYAKPSTHAQSGSAKLRVVHPRPYMTSFCDYLFHPQTKEWLDAMVWSSAQPHSVNDMIQHSFGRHQGDLKAVWARDTLDLDPVAYNKKSATIKDLRKLWKVFPSHSARTTLLVDDSTQKACFQPWNHLFVKEYGQAERRRDLDSLYNRTASQKPSRARTKKGNHDNLDVSDLLDNMTLSPPPIPETTLVSPSSSESVDSILLAVIGILDALKYQDNVSGWLKSGGIVRCGAEDVSSGGALIGHRWFDVVHVVDWWANRGRAALKKLNIDEVVGVVNC
ncbi:NLI interacting factor-like phosphatase-domain-containing protein [Lentinula raphanica]|nr:NLI interacting factor-like phosphatase-domain-containing protein [Lentinula raphanica]